MNEFELNLVYQLIKPFLTNEKSVYIQSVNGFTLLMIVKYIIVTNYPKHNSNRPPNTKFHLSFIWQRIRLKTHTYHYVTNIWVTQSSQKRFRLTTLAIEGKDFNRQGSWHSSEHTRWKTVKASERSKFLATNVVFALKLKVVTQLLLKIA